MTLFQDFYLLGELVFYVSDLLFIQHQNHENLICSIFFYSWFTSSIFYNWNIMCERRKKKKRTYTLL